MSKSSMPSLIDDLTHDVIIVLGKKAKALEAYEKYLSDAEIEDDVDLKELFLEMRRQDEEHVRVLKEALARRLDEDLGYDDDVDDVGVVDEDDDLDDFDDADEVDEPSSTEPVDDVHGVVVTPTPDTPSRRGGDSTNRQR